MVTVTGLTYAFANGRTLSFPDLRVQNGAPCLLLGQSGSGKTTFLHLVGGLRRAQTGAVVVGETDITKLSQAKLDAFRGKRIGFIFQKNHLIPSLSVRENISIAAMLAGNRNPHARIDALLEILGIRDIAAKRPHRISHGQAQRAAIARALVNTPALVLADEPTSALDDLHCNAVGTLLKDMATSEKTAMIIATHDHRLTRIFNHHVTLSET